MTERIRISTSPDKSLSTSLQRVQFTSTGELFYLIGIRLWLSDIGSLDKSRAEVVGDWKGYIDDICDQKKIEKVSVDEDDYH